MESKRLNAAFAAKWSAQIGKRGFAAVPHCIISCSDELGLNLVDKSVLEVIIGKCWEVGEVAWPSVEYICKCIQRKSSTVTASTTRLEKDGWIHKTQRFNDTNLYSLKPAINKLEKHLETCPIFNKQEQSYQKTGGLDIQKTGDYIEPIIYRNNTALNKKKNITPSIDNVNLLNNEQDVDLNNQVQQIYEYYLEELNVNPDKYKLNTKRQTAIKLRLSDVGYEKLKQAIENVAGSPWYLGENQYKWRADLDYITRSCENVEKLSILIPTISAKARRREKIFKYLHEADTQAENLTELQLN